MERNSKVAIFFVIIIFIACAFLVNVAFKISGDNVRVALYKKELEQAIRGDIVSQEGYHLAKSYKTYSVSIDPDAIDPTKKDLFISLFSVYSDMPQSAIKQLLTTDHRVTLLKHIDAITAKNLKELSTTLVKEKVFSPVTISNKTFRKGLEVAEESYLRIYPYSDTLEPILGYVDKEHTTGIVGLEKAYNDLASPLQNGLLQGERDVGSNIVLNKKLSLKKRLDGSSLHLTINLALQKSIEKALDEGKQNLGAAEILGAVMESNTGHIIAIGSSNRYIPTAITQDDVPHIKLDAIQYIFEPGSIIKPIVLSLLLDKNKVNPYQILPGYMGKFTLGEKTITDEHKMGQMSVEEAIIYSSNIGMAQLGQRLEGSEIYNGLRKFGFSSRSGIDLPFEYAGDTPTVNELGTPIYKATISYGYGMRANFVQLLKAYNTITNNGIMITPRLSDGTLAIDKTFSPFPPSPQVQVISPTTAQKMQQILQKVVEYGTGTAAKMEGLTIGGKTGTAHIASRGGYANSYNSSFFGFVTDGKKRYTVGVLVREPIHGHFAAQTAVPVFKKILQNLVTHDFLSAPKTWEVNQTAALLNSSETEKMEKASH